MPADARGNKRTADDQELVRLLCRALSRLAIAAQGIDRRLDELLSELRQLLRRDIDNPQQLSSLVDTIDARIKVVDDERDKRGDVLQESLQSLVQQLLSAKPGGDVARDLKSLQKELKQKFADGEEIKLLARLPRLQAQVLARNADVAPRAGLLARLFGRTETPLVSRPINLANDDVVENDDEDLSSGSAPNATPEIVAQQKPAPALAVTPDAQPSEKKPAQEIALSPQSESVAPDGEPPFARIASAVCHVLDELLQQIDPPPTASDNYQHARAQIAKGLNWYELVSTLEEIGVVVLAALERGQGEFQEFLLGINKRLEEAHLVIQTSRANQTQRHRDDDALNQTVRSEVQQMQAQVAAATQMDSLKTTVASRLDSIINALDTHRTATQTRQGELEDQLGTLTDRLRDMEAQSAAIEKRMQEQQRLALLDTLTQLPNRKAYDQRVAEECERQKRYGRPLTLAVCDVDRFKSINDQFGHLAGDKVLRIIAKTLRARLRKSDFIARFGGEEFVILLPETDCKEALRALETVREAVAQSPFHFKDNPVSVTISIGIANFAANASPDSVFARADTALYKAKDEGRNRCIVAPD